MMDLQMLVLGGVFLLLALIVVGIFVLAFKTCYKVAEPNEALVITGGKGEAGDFKIVSGRGTFVVPLIQTARSLRLNSLTVEPKVDCPTKQGIMVGVKGVVIFKIGDDQDSIVNAARRFLGVPESDIKAQIAEVFAGHLRSIVGGMTVESMIHNREELTLQTRDASAVDLQRLGLVIDSLQIQDINDPSGYIANIAAPNLARVKSEARIAEATADQAANDAEQASRLAVAEAKQVTDLKIADMRAVTEAKNAEADQQGPLAQARAQKQVLVEQTELAQRQADLREQQLNAEVKVAADAEAYRIETTARAERQATISRAEAEAEAKKVNGEAQAAATRAEGQAQAEVVKALGEAEGSALKAKAEGMREGQESVLAQMRVEQLPDVVRAAAAMYDNVKDVTVYDGTDGMQRTMLALIAMGTQAFEAMRGNAPASAEAPNVDFVSANRNGDGA